MIEAIKNLGLIALNEFLQQRENKKYIFSDKEFKDFCKQHADLVAEMLAERIESPKKGSIRVFVLSNECSDNKSDWKFYEEEYDHETYQKYLYCKPRGRKGWFSPSFLYSGNMDECKRKFRAISPPEDIYKLFEEFKEEIREKAEMKSQDKIFFTFKINGNYLSGIREVSEKFMHIFYKDLSTPKKGRQARGEGCCAICGRTSTEVFGSARPYNFYAVDKEGFFQSLWVENAWKNFPVCKNCALLLKFGRIFVDNCFNPTVKGNRTTIGGHRVKVVPKILMLENKLRDLFQKRVFEQFRRIGEKIFPDEVEKIADRESYLLVKLNEMNVVGSYEFLFYKQVQAQFEVLQHISDVLPSRVSNINKAIKTLNDEILKDAFFRSDHLIGFSFGFLRTLFTPISNNTKEHYVLNPLHLVDSIFTGRRVPYKVLMRDFSNRLKAAYLKSLDQAQFMRSNIEREISMMVWLFELLQRLEVIKVDEPNEALEEIRTGIAVLKKFLDKREAFFDCPEKLVCFLLGILFGKIESIQFGDRGAAPIQKHLKSLNLRQHDLERLFSIIREKFMEYGAFSAESREVAEILSSEWTKVRKWQLSKDEIPFYFSLGWVLCKKFLPTKESS